MSTEQSFVDFVIEQMQDVGGVTAKKMFGEYGVFCDGKMVALICDNKLFIKPTVAGKAHIGQITEASPYPGAKPYYLIEDKFEDREWLGRLVRITAEELPVPKPKVKKPKA